MMRPELPSREGCFELECNYLIIEFKPNDWRLIYPRDNLMRAKYSMYITHNKFPKCLINKSIYSGNGATLHRTSRISIQSIGIIHPYPFNFVHMYHSICLDYFFFVYFCQGVKKLSFYYYGNFNKGCGFEILTSGINYNKMGSVGLLWYSQLDLICIIKIYITTNLYYACMHT